MEPPPDHPAKSVDTKPTPTEHTKCAVPFGPELSTGEVPAVRKFSTDIEILRARETNSRSTGLSASDGSKATKARGGQPPEKKRHGDRSPRAEKGKSQRGGWRGKADQKRKMSWREPEGAQASKVFKTADSEAGTETGEKRLPKRKVAVLFGYCGKGYQGSQVNPGMRTIEGEVFKALVEAGCISPDNSAHPAKVGLQRAARTDANVHAGCNLISLKLILEPPSLAQPAPDSGGRADLPLVRHINGFLPDEIRVWRLLRVQNSFHSRTLCDSRTYEYSLPTYLFLPPRPGSAMFERLNSVPIAGSECKWAEWFADGETEAHWWDAHSDRAPPEEGSDYRALQIEKKREYRISQPMVARIKRAVEKFKGTHNFHNFTVGKEFNERNSIRIIRDVSVSEPFLVGTGTVTPTRTGADLEPTGADLKPTGADLKPTGVETGEETGQGIERKEEQVEWISIKFYGQSFMLHQIRKMIGIVILACRTRTPPSIIPELYGPLKTRIPKAPGLGLILERPHFDGYNKRIIEANRHIMGQPPKSGVATEGEREDLVRELIEPEECREEIESFKKRVLYKIMWEEESKEDGFGVWINYLDVYKENDLDFLNPNGVLPPAATSPTLTQHLPSKPTAPLGGHPSGSGAGEGVLGKMVFGEEDECIGNNGLGDEEVEEG